MEAAGFRALNIRCSPVNILRPVAPIRAASLSEVVRGSKPLAPPKPYRASLALFSAASSPSPSCSHSWEYRIHCQDMRSISCWSAPCRGKPLGYKIEDSKLKRAGLDYWPYVVVKIHESWAEFRDYFMQQSGEKRLIAFTKRGTSIHSDFSYKQGDWLVFGSETCGLPPEALEDCCAEGFGGGTIRIPMVETYVRCLNLSVSVGIALYEAARQLNYEQLQLSSESGTERLFLTEDIYG